MKSLKSNKLILYDSLWRNLKVLKITGMYPIEGWSRAAFKTYALILYSILNVPVPVLALWALVANSKSMSIEEITSDIFLIAQIAVEIFKHFPFKNSPQDSVKTVEWLKEDIFVKVHPEHLHILKETAAFSRSMFGYYFVYCLIAYAVYVLKCTRKAERKLHLNIYLPFDPFKNAFLYHGINLFIDTVVLNGCLVNSSLDTMIPALIWHAAGQIKLLKAKLRDLVKHSLEDLENLEHSNKHNINTKNTKNTIMYTNMRDCIKHHNAIKQYVKDLEKTYSVPVFSQLGMSVLVICFTLFVLTIIEPYTYAFYSSLSFLIAMLVEVFLFCYCGTLLFEESSTILQEISNMNWIELDNKSKKALILLMESSKNPLMIKAGGLINLSLETFLTIVRRSYSLLAVLNTYNA